MKKIWIIALSLIFLFSIALISCQQSTEKAAEVSDKAAVTTAGYGSKASSSGEDLRKIIYEQTPYLKWALWPGKGMFFEGTEPHGDFITVYVNDTALASIRNVSGMADNSIVVKENYDKAKQLTSVTVMRKVKGFNPEKGDWFWARFGPDSKITHEGNVEMCYGCHAAADDNDYIFVGKVTVKGSAGHAAPGYGKPAPGYGKEAPGYGKPAPGYGKPAPGYGKEAPGYGKPAPGYGKPAPGYGKEAPGYGKPAPGYDKPATK